MLERRRIEGRIVEDIERRLSLRRARIDIPRNMVGKDVGPIERYPAPNRDQKETCQTGIPAIDTCWELHCR